MNYLLTGAHIKLFINNTLYKEVNQVAFTVDYGEAPNYGIDVDYPQEIAGTRMSVTGQVSGMRVKMSGGLQAYNLRPLTRDRMQGGYVSIRIQNRQDGEDIIFIPQAKVSKESHTVAAKGIYRLSFDFIGQIPWFALDRA